MKNKFLGNWGNFGNRIADPNDHLAILTLVKKFLGFMAGPAHYFYSLQTSFFVAPPDTLSRGNESRETSTSFFSKIIILNLIIFGWFFQ